MMRASAHRIRRALVLALVMALFGGAAPAWAGQALRTVTFHGYMVTIPRLWPVFDLARQPGTCVRFNRHALYLGIPSGRQRCGAQAAGRTEAILLEPLGASASQAGSAAIQRLGGSAASFVVRDYGVRVIATWLRDRQAVERALHRSALPGVASLSRAGRPATLLPRADLAGVLAHTAQAVYTGLGFDACSAPSTQTMSDWSSSPYHAIGVYIGGVNSACAQPNLTSSWVSTEVAAGWHLIPTYVGLQAPTNSCGCASIVPSQAAAEGAAAAEDAVTQAQGLGLPPGNPIYDDMEAYSRGATNTSVVLAFLSGWTSQLHAEGYLSGVYSSSNSGISDLVANYGTSYHEPDDIWIANWNGQESTSDSSVPSSDWANNQRLHQYRGAHNETYRGATINIDSDYLDGATADTVSAGSAATPTPTLSVSTTASGMTNLSTGWSGAGLATWQVLAGTSLSQLSTIATQTANGPQAKITVRSGAPYFAVQALGSSAQVLANSATVPAPAHLLLFGRSAFVSEGNGVGGLPAGCYLVTNCHVVTTVAVGRLTIARTGTELIPASSTATLFFKLTPQGRKLLANARGARLPVQVTTKDVSGRTAFANLLLIPFSASGRAPARSSSPSAAAHALGLTDFVFAHGAGGILAGCDTVSACKMAATLTVGRTTIASTGSELMGGREASYVQFSLSAQGRQLLTRAPGNQLGASLQLRVGSSVARARIVLIQFS